jgi:hypothetical protein
MSHWSDNLKYKRVYFLFRNMILFFKSVIHVCICTHNQQLYQVKNVFLPVLLFFSQHAIGLDKYFIYLKWGNNCNKQFFDKFNELRWVIIVRFVDIGGIFIWHQLLVASLRFPYSSFPHTCTFIYTLIMLISIFRISLKIYCSEDNVQDLSLLN